MRAGMRAAARTAARTATIMVAMAMAMATAAAAAATKVGIQKRMMQCRYRPWRVLLGLDSLSRCETMWWPALALRQRPPPVHESGMPVRCGPESRRRRIRHAIARSRLARAHAAVTAARAPLRAMPRHMPRPIPRSMPVPMARP